MAKGKIFIASTLAADVVYRSFAATKGDVPVADGGVLIKGGSGVANKRLETPQGVITEVTPEQLGLLERDPVFVMHRKNGYIQVTHSASAPEPEVAASDMESRDASAQLQDGDFQETTDKDGIKTSPTPVVNSDDKTSSKNTRKA